MRFWSQSAAVHRFSYDIAANFIFGRETDTYHETKTRFTWVGEIQNERLHAGLEKLSDEELQLVTLYFHEKYSTVELSKVYGIAQQSISKRILKITKFLKNFDFQGVE